MMKLFGKKKEDEEVDEEEEELDKKRGLDSKVVVKKVRRRNPEKEERPWGKKERLLVLFTLLLTAGMSAVLGLSGRDLKFPSAPQIDLAKPHFSFWGSEKIILEDAQSSPEFTKRSEEIRRIFSDVSKSSQGNYGIYISSISSPGILEINSNTKVVDEKFRRLLLTYIFYKAEADQKIILKDKYTSEATQEDITYEILLEDTNYSAHTLFPLAQRLFGDEYLSSTLSSLELSFQTVENGEISPGEEGKFIKKLLKEEVFPNDTSKKLLHYLKEDMSFEENFEDSSKSIYKSYFATDTTIDIVNVIQDKEGVIIVLSGNNILSSEAHEFASKVFATFD